MPPKTTTTKPKKFIPKKSSPSTPSFSAKTKFLIIVESPSKCKKIEEYLGADYQCIASKGHLRSIENLKSIDTKNNYAITFQTIKEKESHIAHMRQIIDQYSSDSILVASDDDREGEAIAWHICCMFNLPVATTKRIKFHEITKPALLEAIATPTTVNMSLVYAQHARQVLDIIVGFTISPLLWKHIHFNKTNALSAGRCQTPTLRLIYDNYLENKAKEVETTYRTVGYFFEKSVPFTLAQEYSSQDEMRDFLEKSKTFSHQLSFSDTKETSQSSPKPFTTSKLLQSASNLYHYNPKTTMDLCQQLYQAGHITYMRTDSAKYSPIFLEKARAFILSEYDAKRNGDYLGDFSKIVNSDAANPHEAIRVTNIAQRSISSENKSLVAMYRLIWRNTVESCMAAARYNTTTAYISAPNEGQYSHRIDVPIFLGWKVVGGDDIHENQNLATGLLFFMKSLAGKTKIDFQYIESTTSIKNQPSHYTEASLIQKLEELGIGRPSTFATIVDTNVERGYVKKMDLEGKTIQCIDLKLRGGEVINEPKERRVGVEKNKLVIQPTGIVCLEFLLKHFSTFFSYDYTKTMEEQLDITAASSDAENMWFTICKDCHTEIKTLSKPISKMEKETYKIGEYTLAFHSFGASLCKIDETGEKKYHNVKKEIEFDLDKLKRGEYTLEELMEKNNEYLGEWNESPVLLKNGRFGLYLENGEKKISLKTLKIPADKITLGDVMPFLSSPNGVVTGANIVNKSILRVLTPELSIRKGKYGAYIFYQRGDMKTPEFFSIKGFSQGFAACNSEDLIEWIRDKYKIEVY